MIFYQLEDCSGSLSNIWTDSDLEILGLNVGSVFQAEGFVGTCWRIVNIIDELFPPGPTEDITINGTSFSSCAQCLDSIIFGCMDSIACNYNPCATIDDGSCFYNNVTIRILCNDPITTCNINSNCN